MFASRGRLGSFRRLFPIVKDAEREHSFPIEVCVMNAERNRWIEGQTLAKVLGIIVCLFVWVLTGDVTKRGTWV